MTFTLTISAQDWSAVGAVPGSGELLVQFLYPVLGPPITTTSAWKLQLDGSGAGSWLLPSIPANNALMVTSGVRGLYLGRTFWFSDPGSTGSVTFSQLLSHQVDPTTLTPSASAVPAWDAAVANVSSFLSQIQVLSTHVDDQVDSVRLLLSLAQTAASTASTEADSAISAAGDALGVVDEARGLVDGMVVGGTVTNGDLILSLHSGATTNAGRVGVRVVSLTQSAYDALVTPDPLTLYIRTEG